MIGVTFSVDERRLEAHLDRMSDRLRSKLSERITSLTAQLLERIHAAEPMRTGRLRSETQMLVDHGEDWVRGRVRIMGQGREHNEAAAALEYGAQRSFNVRAYMEKRSAVFGRSIAPEPITVKAYRRHANIRPRRFLRDPAEAMRSRIEAEIQAAIDDAVREQ